jgi:hypothetical protein
MIEYGFYDLSLVSSHARGILNLTVPDDPRWTGIVKMLAGDVYETRANHRTDIFIINGSVLTYDDVAQSEGSFLTFSKNCQVVASDLGAVLFVYREPFDGQQVHSRQGTSWRTGQMGSGRQSSAPLETEGRGWREARIEGMRVADLTVGGYQLSLVHWEPGTRVPAHDHTNGEDIFVLEGELLSQGRPLPAGSWVRLQNGTAHAPYVKISTLIILRNGHISAE